MADRDLVINALLREQFRKERVPFGVSSGDLRRKIHQWCKDLGLRPEAVGQVILPIIDEMLKETQAAFHEAFNP